MRFYDDDVGGGDWFVDPPSPPAEKATASQDHAWKSSTGDRSWNPEGTKQPVHLAVDDR
jgi:hypothetical protein